MPTLSERFPATVEKLVNRGPYSFVVRDGNNPNGEDFIFAKSLTAHELAEAPNELASIILNELQEILPTDIETNELLRYMTNVLVQAMNTIINNN